MTIANLTNHLDGWRDENDTLVFRFSAHLSNESFVRDGWIVRLDASMVEDQGSDQPISLSPASPLLLTVVEPRLEMYLSTNFRYGGLLCRDRNPSDAVFVFQLRPSWRERDILTVPSPQPVFIFSGI